MSRVIKFRGINVIGEFAYGLLVGGALKNSEFKFCIENDSGLITPIRTGTESQFTGLHDVTGEEIYEGDIVRWGHIAGYEEYNPRKAVVEFSPDLTFATFNLEKNHKFRFGNFAYRNTDDALEIIGNIYQNPELLNHG